MTKLLTPSAIKIAIEQALDEHDELYGPVTVQEAKVGTSKKGTETYLCTICLDQPRDLSVAFYTQYDQKAKHYQVRALSWLDEWRPLAQGCLDILSSLSMASIEYADQYGSIGIETQRDRNQRAVKDFLESPADDEADSEYETDGMQINDLCKWLRPGADRVRYGVIIGLQKKGDHYHNVHILWLKDRARSPEQACDILLEIARSRIPTDDPRIVRVTQSCESFEYRDKPRRGRGMAFWVFDETDDDPDYEF